MSAHFSCDVYVDLNESSKTFLGFVDRSAAIDMVCPNYLLPYTKQVAVKSACSKHRIRYQAHRRENASKPTRYRVERLALLHVLLVSPCSMSECMLVVTILPLCIVMPLDSTTSFLALWVMPVRSALRRILSYEFFHRCQYVDCFGDVINQCCSRSPPPFYEVSAMSRYAVLLEAF